MVEICVMASYLPAAAISHQQERALLRHSKEFQSLRPFPLKKQEKMISSCSFHLACPLVGDSWKPTSWFLESNNCVKLDSTVGSSALINLQDTCPDSVPPSFFFAGNCTQHKKISQFLLSGLSEAEKDGLDFSILADLMGLDKLAVGFMSQTLALQDEAYRLYGDGFDGSQASLTYPHSLIYPRKHLYAPKPLLDLIGDLASTSKVAVHPDGRVLFTGTGAEMKDLLSIVAEFYLSKNSTKWRKQPMLIPHFTRMVTMNFQTSLFVWVKIGYDKLDTVESLTNVHLKLGTVKATPLKRHGLRVLHMNFFIGSYKRRKRNMDSSVKIKMKSLRRTTSKKAHRDLYRKSYFHTCESFMSLIINKRRGKMAILTLKKSGPELPQFLTQFSAGIAGTGLAVLFSVVYKVGGGRVPFCASKVLNTVLGFALVWLSSAVNNLRDSVFQISKSSSKLGLKEEEMMMKRVDGSVNDIYFRAATLVVMVVLRIA
ncbi:hypothetical protein GIB67_006827 [Kingdonia uniflora]|uniref:Uncharacterized protein n=1 Tax=Kingdonia uniflora TaxID=39325 RepID=A0A7J7KZY5_9MAGN|nr:hypothetical protein GIB67_006827 [Kingdonia uniflora]